MFVWRVFTWTLKLILKILLLPVVLVVAALSIFAKIAYYLGAAALGLGMLVLFACLGVSIYQQNWTGVAVVIIAGAALMAIGFAAAFAIVALEGLTSAMTSFLVS